MERATQSEKSNEQQPSAAPSARRSVVGSFAPQSSRLGQLADNINSSPHVQRLAQMKKDIQRSPLVAGLRQFAEEVQSGATRQLVEKADPNLSQSVVQRMQEKVGEEWKEKEVDFASLTQEQVDDIRSKMHSLFNPNGIYKLSPEEVKKLNTRSTQLYNSPEARRLREQKALEDDVVALRLLQTQFEAKKKWTLVGTPTHMGESSSSGFLQNWEAGFTIEGLRGVLHLHFDTNEKSEISKEKLGKAHIKTSLASKAGNFDAPKEMIEEAIKAIPKS